jgi:hypothetical protein
VRETKAAAEGRDNAPELLSPSNLSLSLSLSLFLPGPSQAPPRPLNVPNAPAEDPFHTTHGIRTNDVCQAQTDRHNNELTNKPIEWS